MRSIARTGLVLASVGVMVTGIGVAARGQTDAPRRPSRGDIRRAAPTTAPTLDSGLRLHIDVIRLELGDEQLQQIDQSSGPVDVNALLSDGLQAGRTQVVQIFNTPIVVGEGLALTTMIKQPLVSGSSTNDKGVVTRAINYENVGCIVSGRTCWVEGTPSQYLRAEWNVELSGVDLDPQVRLSENVSAPVIVRLQQKFEALVKMGEPMLFSALATRSRDADRKEQGVIYVFRVQFQPIESGD
ncbi:MAG: hypothetical protein JXB13_08810 [Phycisphaerae bacterium]|nr:hypothetical protein [Phycisphaerae bacterium]